jgi:hypothetical protein
MSYVDRNEYKILKYNLVFPMDRKSFEEKSGKFISQFGPSVVE